MLVRYSKNKIMIGIFLFLFIYMPPLFSISMIHVLGVVSWGIIILKYNKSALHIIFKKEIFIYLINLIFAVFLLAITITFTTRNFYLLKNQVLIILEVIPCIILICINMRKNKIYLDDLFRILLIVATIQSIISITMFLFPTIKEIVLNRFYYNEYVIGEYAIVAQNRIFGFSNGLTFGMPVVQGFMAIVAFIYATSKSKKFFLYIPPLLFSASINARTGIFVFFIGLTMYIGLYIKSLKLKGLLNATLVFSALVLSLILVIHFISSSSNSTFKWIIDAYYETRAFLSGKRVGYYAVLEKFVFFPSGMNLFYGEGMNYFGKVHPIHGVSTDIGYINDLFLGGMLFVVVLYFGYLKIFMLSKKVRYKGLDNLPIIMIALLFVLNIKGSAFWFNNFFNLFLLIIFMFILEKDKKTHT